MKTIIAVLVALLTFSVTGTAVAVTEQELPTTVEVYLGRKIPTNVRATGFSCSC